MILIDKRRQMPINHLAQTYGKWIQRAGSGINPKSRSNTAAIDLLRKGPISPLEFSKTFWPAKFGRPMGPIDEHKARRTAHGKLYRLIVEGYVRVEYSNVNGRRQIERYAIRRLP